MDKNSDKQVNYGKNNSNINIDELFIIINNGDKIAAVDFFDAFADALEKYDTYMIDRFGKKIIVNKTGMEEDFSASKILKSLLTIGIPLDAAFTIFKTALTKLSEQHITGEKLETKEIRKKVCDSIQICDLKKYAPSQIQSWSQKYVRKYGRNNQVVKVKMNNDSTTEISRTFLKQFVVDLIQTISPNISINSISNSNMREIADCVLDFVNSCDVYIIRYDVLKSIIMEIALQPPHPWFINDETKSTIISYDTKQLKTNLTKAKQCFNDGTYVVPQSILLEIIHHASSMILSKYGYFLGCNDLSSLHLLHSLLEDLINKPYEDLLFDEFPINKLLSDITKADLKYDEYLNLIKHICAGVNTQILNTVEFSKKVYNFGINSLSIIEKSSADFSKFYNQNWENISLLDIMSNIMMFMNASFGHNEIKSDKYKDKCYFWYKLDRFALVYLVMLKKVFLCFTLPMLIVI